MSEDRPGNDKRWTVIHLSGSNSVPRTSVTSLEVADGLRDGSLSWADFAQVGGAWKRLFEVDEFKNAMPTMPGASPFNSLRAKAKVIPAGGVAPGPLASPEPLPDSSPTSLPLESGPHREGPLFVQFDGTEYGPISTPELKSLLEEGRVQGMMYVWRRGMGNWAPAASLPELAGIAPPAPDDGGLSGRPVHRIVPFNPVHEKRKSPRAPLIATAWRVLERRFREVLGVCSDVSETGVQVLLDTAESLELGGLHQIEIVPIVSSGVSPFVIEAKVVWCNPAEWRAGFVFTSIGDADRRALALHFQRAQPAPR